MRRSGVLASAALLLAVTLGESASTQSASSVSALAGMVVRADNAPVPCARVVLQGAGQVLSMRTSADGRFAFEKIPFRPRWIGVEGVGSTVVDDTRFPDVANIQLFANTAALLAGVLLDEHHQPMRNIEVTALARRQQYGRPRFVPVANDVTDADGSYCIQVPSIQAGVGQRASGVLGPPPADERTSEFLVGVIPTGTWLPHPVWATNIVGLPGRPPTYFPSVTTSGAAKVLSVPYGGVRREVNFALQAGRVTRIEGDILNPDVLTLSASDLVLEPPDEEVAIHRRATPDAKGHFVFKDVAPGEYTVRLFPISRVESIGRWGVKQVSVRGESMVHVIVPSQPTHTFAGAASFAGAPTMLPGVRLVFTVNAARITDPLDRFPSSFYPSTFSSSDGQGGFAIKNLVPGKYRLSISGADWRGWHLDAITMPLVGEDGSVTTRDVTKTPLIVEAGRDTFGVAVRLSPEVPQIAGVVVSDRGELPSPGTRVIIFPGDPKKWTAELLASSQEIADVTPRSDGTFTIQDLPVGGYLAVAVLGAPRIDAGLLLALQPFATAVAVKPPPVAARMTLTELRWPPRHPTVDPRRRSKR